MTTSDTIYFSFDINPYIYEDLNTTYGPTLLNLVGGSISEDETAIDDQTYGLKFYRTFTLGDDASGIVNPTSKTITDGTGTNWSNSMFNPSKGLLDYKHCFSQDSTPSDKEVLALESESSKFHLVYTKYGNGNSFNVSIADNVTINVDFGDDIYNVDAVVMYNVKTGYVLGYAISPEELQVTGHYEIPFVSDSHYGRILMNLSRSYE